MTATNAQEGVRLGSLTHDGLAVNYELREPVTGHWVAVGVVTGAGSEGPIYGLLVGSGESESAAVMDLSARLCGEAPSEDTFAVDWSLGDAETVDR